MKIRMVISLCLICAAAAANAQPAAPLTLARTIALKPITGKFDHLAYDAAGSRLFVAATGNHSVEVVNTASGAVVESIGGLGKPHGLAWVASTGGLYVADGSLAELRVYKGSPFALAGKIKLSEDADDMVYDEANHLLFVGHGTGEAASPGLVAVVDTASFTVVASIPVAAHPEALEIDPQGHRVFVNIADSSEVAVIDTATKAVTAHWKLTRAAHNVPLAFDAERHLLYVACRTPGTLIALDGVTGKELASVPSAGGVDDLFYDAALGRVYLIAGVGEVDSYQVEKGGALRGLGTLQTAPGAKTALFVPSRNLLYVGVPGAGDKPAGIRVFSTEKR
jgi:DNA-binding beta-propeller fold protein YncE